MALKRKKCIFIEDSYIKHYGLFEKKSLTISAKNPLKRDETVIDYDMDSEEEWNEQNGEDLEGKQEDEQEEDEVDKLLLEEGEADVEEGFIVPDDYLSASELNLSQCNDSQMQHELEERRKQIPKKSSNVPVANLASYSLIFTLNGDKKMVNYMEEFKAVTFPKDKPFPLKLHRKDELELGFNGCTADEKLTNSALKLNPKAIYSHLTELVMLMHGSFESKPKIIEDFNTQFPDCSKKSIEKKTRDLFVKDKRDNDPRTRWYATESTLADHNLVDSPDLAWLMAERLNVVLEEVAKLKEEQDKIKEDKKLQAQLEK